MISNDANILIYNFVTTNIVQVITHLAIFDATGELCRKTPTDRSSPTPDVNILTFYLTEEEVKNTTITKLSLLDINGKEIATQAVSQYKGYPESLVITWDLRVI